MTIGADAAKEQVDAAKLLNLLLVGSTFGFQIGRIAVEDMDVLLGAIDVVEQVGEHKAVVALGMVNRQTDILVHIKGDDILERHLALLTGLDQCTVHTDRRRAGGKSKDKRFLSRRLGSVDTLNDMIGGPLGHQIIIRFNNYSHSLCY